MSEIVHATDNLPDLESLPHEQLVKLARLAQADAAGWRDSAEALSLRCAGLEGQIKHLQERLAGRESIRQDI